MAKTHDLSHLKEYQYKPGQSGNPGGRPKSIQARVLEKLGEDGLDEAAAHLTELIKQPGFWTDDDKRGPLRAMILDRIWPSKQILELQTNQPLELRSGPSLEALAQALALADAHELLPESTTEH